MSTITDIVEIRNSVTNMKDPAQVAAAWAVVRNAKAYISETEKMMKAYTLGIMEEHGVKEIILDEGLKIYKTTKKTDRYDTSTVYKALSFTEEQIAVLPKNPSFRKTAILANEKTAVAWSEDVTDEVVLKELDDELMKRLGRAA